MSRDGDVALDGQAMRAVREERLKAALAAAIEKDDGGWKKHTPFHWQRAVDGSVINYWPTKEKFSFRGEMFHELSILFNLISGEQKGKK